MTLQKDVSEHEDYISIFEHGFVGIAQEEDEDGNLFPAVMGNDKSITRAARMSYGKGTKAVQNDRGLLRYLLRHKHTTPFEMAEIKFHAKMPIFVARQWVRHRTANINEYSARYSVMTDEFYIPEDEHIQPQSLDNKQGRDGTLSDNDKTNVKNYIKDLSESSYDVYETLITPEDEFPGIARELARTVLPVNVYTEWYWKCDLHNVFRFLQLRMDPHAQYEIRVYADAMYELVKRYFPVACEAFEDYVLHAKSFSRMEMEIIQDLITGCVDLDKIDESNYGLSKRELNEFLSKLKD